MAHIVIVPEKVRTRPFVNIAVSRMLVERGHQVTYVGHVDARDAVEAVGARFIESVGVPQHLWQPPEGSYVDRLRRLPGDLRRRRARLDEQVERTGLAESIDLMRELAPDLVVADMESLTQIAAARCQAIPTIATTIWPQPFKRPGNPPPHTPIVPGRGFAGSRLGIELAWARFRLWRIVKGAGTFVRDGGADLGSVYRHVVRTAGLSVRQDVDQLQWAIPMSSAVPTIGFTSPAFDLPGPSHPLFTGASSVIAEPDPSKVSPEIRAILERNADSGRPLLYVSFGSFVTWDDGFLDRSLDALGRHPEWDVIVGLGGKSVPGGDVPDHVHLFEFAPQVEILEHADLAFLHGGGHSLHEALRNGVPIVAYPFLEVHDHPGNGARVEFHGVGVVGQRTESADEIEARLVHVLGNADMKAAAETMQAAMLRELDERPIDEVIESFLP